MQTHTFPFTVFSTQHRQAPSPQAIVFSSETSQSIPRRRATEATAFIIGIGPQQYIRSKFSFAITGLSTTVPEAPIEPSSVDIYTFLDYLPKDKPAQSEAEYDDNENPFGRSE